MSRQSQWAAIQHALVHNFATPLPLSELAVLERKIRSWRDLDHLLTAVEQAQGPDNTASVLELLAAASRIAREAKDLPRPTDQGPNTPETQQEGSTAVSQQTRRTSPSKPAACRGCDGSGYVDAGTRTLGKHTYDCVEPCQLCNIGAAYMHHRGHYDLDAPRGDRYEADSLDARDAVKAAGRRR